MKNQKVKNILIRAALALLFTFIWAVFFGIAILQHLEEGGL